QNVWRLIKNINFVQDIKPNGELVGRRDMAAGKHENLCPFIAGGMSWNMGSYNPKTGLLYKVGNEWCMDLEIAKTTPILEPMAQLNIGANFNITNPKGDKAHGHVSGRDPITGKMTWEVKFPEPPLASLLSTGGDLLFVPDPRGWLRAYDARTGKELWKHNNGQRSEEHTSELQSLRHLVCRLLLEKKKKKKKQRRKIKKKQKQK